MGIPMNTMCRALQVHQFTDVEAHSIPRQAWTTSRIYVAFHVTDLDIMIVTHMHVYVSFYLNIETIYIYI